MPSAQLAMLNLFPAEMNDTSFVIVKLMIQFIVSTIGSEKLDQEFNENVFWNNSRRGDETIKINKAPKDSNIFAKRATIGMENVV